MALRVPSWLRWPLFGPECSALRDEAAPPWILSRRSDAAVHDSDTLVLGLQRSGTNLLRTLTQTMLLMPSRRNVSRSRSQYPYPMEPGSLAFEYCLPCTDHTDGTTHTDGTPRVAERGGPASTHFLVHLAAFPDKRPWSATRGQQVPFRMAHLGDFDRLYGSRTLSYVVGVKHPLSWLASATRFWGIAANASLLEARSSTLLGLLRTWNAYHAKWIELIEHDGGRHHAALLQYERLLADPAAAVRELGRRLGWRPHPNPGSWGLPTTLDGLDLQRLKVKISEGHSYSQDRKKYLDLVGILRAEPYATRRAREVAAAVVREGEAYRRLGYVLPGDEGVRCRVH